MKQKFTDLESEVTNAENCKRQGNFALAASMYQNLIEHQPKNAFLYNKLAQVKAQAQEWREAIALYQKALDLEADNPFWIYRNLGDALRAVEEFERAIKSYQQAISLQPGQPEVYDSLGQTQYLIGDSAGAISSYQKAIELGIKNPFWTYQNLGDALSKENRQNEAQEAYAWANKISSGNADSITVSPDLPEDKSQDDNWLAIHSQGDEHFKLEEWQAAISFYQRATELNPDYFWSYYNLSRALSELERWKNSQQAIQKAIALQPEFALAYGYLAVTQHNLSSPQEALKTFKKAVELDPNLPGWVYEKMADTLAALGHPQPNKQEKKLVRGDKIDEDTWRKQYAGNLRRLKEEFQFCQRAFILDKDLDLDDDELRLLKNEVTIATDESISRLAALNFNPTFYVVEDGDQALEHSQHLDNWSEIFKLIPRKFAPHFAADSQTIFLNQTEANTYPDYRDFSTDATECTYTGISPIHTCLQLACYLGFADIYTIGVDEKLTSYRRYLNILQANKTFLYNVSIDSEFAIFPPRNYYNLFPAESLYPRVLIVDMTRMGGITATGQIKSTLFADWPHDFILQVYSRGRDTFSLYTQGSFTDNQNEFDDLQQLLAECQKFQPDVIYYRPVADRPKLDEFANLAIQELNVPIVTHIMDDWPDRLAVQNPELYDKLDSSFRKLLQKSAVRLSISARMSEALEKRYELNFVPIANCIEPETWIELDGELEELPRRTNFVMRYVGGLADDMNFTSIKEIARSVSSLRALGVSLEIYTMSHWKQKAIDALGNLEGVSIHDANFSVRDYQKLLASADALIIAYNFDSDSIRYVRYSMANKLPECMASGSPILLYGPQEVATVEYAASSNGVVAVTKQDNNQLSAAIEQMLTDTNTNQILAQTARRFVFENHHGAKIRSRLTRIFRQASMSSKPM